MAVHNMQSDCSRPSCATTPAVAIRDDDFSVGCEVEAYLRGSAKKASAEGSLKHEPSISLRDLSLGIHIMQQHGYRRFVCVPRIAISVS